MRHDDKRAALFKELDVAAGAVADSIDMIDATEPGTPRHEMWKRDRAEMVDVMNGALAALQVAVDDLTDGAFTRDEVAEIAARARDFE